MRKRVHNVGMIVQGLLKLLLNCRIVKCRSENSLVIDEVREAERPALFAPTQNFYPAWHQSLSNT